MPARSGGGEKGRGVEVDVLPGPIAPGVGVDVGERGIDPDLACLTTCCGPSNGVLVAKGVGFWKSPKFRTVLGPGLGEREVRRIPAESKFERMGRVRSIDSRLARSVFVNGNVDGDVGDAGFPIEFFLPCLVAAPVAMESGFAGVADLGGCDRRRVGGGTGTGSGGGAGLREERSSLAGFSEMELEGDIDVTSSRGGISARERCFAHSFVRYVLTIFEDWGGRSEESIIGFGGGEEGFRERVGERGVGERVEEVERARGLGDPEDVSRPESFRSAEARDVVEGLFSATEGRGDWGLMVPPGELGGRGISLGLVGLYESSKSKRLALSSSKLRV